MCVGQHLSHALQVVDEDGAVLACAINAACAALIDAAIPMTTRFGMHILAAKAMGPSQLALCCLQPACL